MKSSKLFAFTSALIMYWSLASCGVTAQDTTTISQEDPTSQTEPVSEEIVSTFTPIEITDDYTGEILGLKNWRIAKNSYWWSFYNDDTGELLAEFNIPKSLYLADLNGDGQPELVCNGASGIKFDPHTYVCKLEDGVISFSSADMGKNPIEACSYYNFAKANSLDINDTNVDNYSDIYDPERNKIFVTDSATNTEYEYKWEYFDFYPYEEIKAMCEADETDTETPSDNIEISYKTSEPDIKDISDNEKELTFYRDDKEMEGRLYLPEGEGDFPVVVLSCGLEQPYTDYVEKAKGFAENGYAAVVYTFVDYNENEIHGQDDKVFLSEAADLNAVLDSLSELPNIDTDRVYIWGHSFGGLASTYVGIQRSNEIKAIIGVEPTLLVGERMALDTEPKATLRIFSLMKDLKTPMLIFMGTHDGFGEAPDAFKDALAASSKVELKIIDDADHFFEGEAETEMVKFACMYMSDIEKR